MAKKVFKIIGRVLLIILGAVVLFLLGTFIFHRITLAGEEKTLTEKGYLNRVSVGEYSLNVCSYGSDSPKHTLVGLSGMGVHNYSAAMRPITDKFADENKIVFVDRAGYGLSDDTTIPQTTERIVEDYRNALKNAGFEPPYIIIPHSLGGMYTTYWLSTHPEEIEGVVFLDCSEITNDENPFDNKAVGFSDYLYFAACNIGLQRLFYGLFDPMSLAEVPDELRDVNNAIIMNKAYTTAMMSESELVNENYRFTYRNMKATDVPKVYICSGEAVFTKDDFREMIAMMNELNEKTGASPAPLPDDDVIETMLVNLEQFREESVFPYIEALGNCEIKYVNGTHMVYIHKPKETAEIIGEFLNSF